MSGQTDLPFVLGLIGAVFALGQGAMMGLILPFVLGISPGAFGAAELGLIAVIFGWFALVAVIGGAIMLTGALRIRKTSDPAARRREGKWLIAGGVVVVFGGNMVGAALGVAAGAVALAQAPPPGPAPA